MQKKGKLFVISGSSGVGKGTVLKEFLRKNPEIELSISATTRYMRNNEKDGIHYFFISKEEFEQDIKNDKFLEWAKYSDNFYGTKKDFVNKKLENNINVVLEIDIQGAFQVKQKMKEAILIFILPPSYEELERRLRNRATDPEEVILKRLSVAKKEIEQSEKFDKKIVNDNIINAVNCLQEIYENEKC